MTYVLCVLGGLVVGGLVAWLVASARVAKSLTAKIEDLARQANTAEGRASGLEGTIAELRAQNQKASEDFTKIREQLASENGAKVKAETQLTETVQRLDEEKKLLDDAKAKLTDTANTEEGRQRIEFESAFQKVNCLRRRECPAFAAGALQLQFSPRRQRVNRKHVKFSKPSGHLLHRALHAALHPTVAEYDPGAFEFGLWFGATSPVDTSGPPDQTVDYVSGQGEYQAARAQTAPEYVAVAAYTDTEQCPAAEIFMDWDSLAPVSPPDQYATQQA
jgi:hypothetical protein